MFLKLFKNKKNTIITLVLIGIIVICAYLIYIKRTNDEVFNNISLNKIENFDGIIGSRHMPGSKILIRQPLKRRIAGRVFSFLTRMLMSFKYQDTQCGGKIFKKEVIKNIIQDIEVKGWAFDVGLLSCAYENGFAIKEYPITWYHDDNSKIKKENYYWRWGNSLLTY